MTSNRIAKFEYLSNHFVTISNFHNKQNISNEDDLEKKMTLNRRLPKIAKLEYLSNHWSNLPQI